MTINASETPDLSNVQPDEFAFIVRVYDKDGYQMHCYGGKALKTEAALLLTQVQDTLVGVAHYGTVTCPDWSRLLFRETPEPLIVHGIAALGLSRSVGAGR